MNYKKEVEQAMDSFCKSWTDMDFNTFSTVSWFTYDPLIANSWTKRLLRMIRDLEKKQISSKKVAGLFPNMSTMRVQMGFDMWTAKYANITAKERLEIAKFYIDGLNAYCLEDPYALQKNIIHSALEINDLLKNVGTANPSAAKKLGRLINACYHLGHAAYSDMYPDIVYDNYGPYDVSDKYGPNHIVAIKDFGNLQFSELWPEYDNLPWMHINIVNVYKNITMRVDAASHVIYEGDLINNLQSFRLKVDGKTVAIEEVDKISEQIEQKAIKLFNTFQAYDVEERKKKYYHQKAYVYKNVYDFLDQKWQPDEEILAEAKDKPLYQAKWPETKAAEIELIKKIFDPWQPLPVELSK